MIDPARRERLVVAIPACDEAERIEACLSALARQRDERGAPVDPDSYRLLVYANNCTDGTPAVVTAWSRRTAVPVELVVEQLRPEESNAGHARRRAMDLAAALVDAGGGGGGGRGDGAEFLFTTDADTVVSSTWIAATLAAFAEGADAVAGYLEVDPSEMMRLGPAFLRRSRLEDRYLRLVAEIHAVCDPRAHDPWPNHRISSGASLAVRLSAYRAVGGVPARALGEDAAFTRALDDAGFKVRHALSVHVATSCRFEGRAPGGTADTMRRRHADVEAPCGDDIEPALEVARRALRRRRGLDGSTPTWPSRALRPADLPREIHRAEMILRCLHGRAG